MGKSCILIPSYSGDHKGKHCPNLNYMIPTIVRNGTRQRELQKSKVITVQEMKELKMDCDLLVKNS